MTDTGLSASCVAAAGRQLRDFTTQNTNSGLLPAEDKLLSTAQRGGDCVLIERLLERELAQEICLLPDPAHERCGHDVRVRAEFVRYLALGADPEHPLQGNGLHVVGAHIIGRLDLHACEVTFPLSFRNCWFDQDLNFRDAELRRVDLCGSRVPGISADGAVIKGSFVLANGFRCEGPLLINEIEVSGSLNCDGSQLLAGKGKMAIGGRSASIKGDMAVRNSRVVGQVYLGAADIGASVEFSGTIMDNGSPDGRGIALVLQAAEIGENLFFRDGAQATGAIWLNNAQIRGEVDFSNALIANVRGSIALHADGAKIGSHVRAKKATLRGETSFFRATITGTFESDGARFINGRGFAAVNAAGLSVGNMLMRCRRGSCWNSAAWPPVG